MYSLLKSESVFGLIEDLGAQDIACSWGLGEVDACIKSVVAWQLFVGEGLTFFTKPDPLALCKWKDCRNCIIICNYESQAQVGAGPYLFVDNPKYVFAFLLNKRMAEVSAYVHPSAIIHPEAVIGRNVSVGPGSVIGRAKIAENVRIGALVYIADDAVEIGEDVIIESGVHIGTDGIGTIKDSTHRLIPFPHFGRVIIERNVWIGSNAELHRGSLLDTIIKTGTHIGSRSEIGHNVIVGEDVCIASGVIIAGSTTIGRGCYIGCGAFVNNGLEIANDVTIGAHATVMRDCLDEGTTILPPQSKNIGKMFGWS